MTKRSLAVLLGAGVAAPAFGLFYRYRKDVNAARARLTAVERRVISTPWGTVEYAEQGEGDPVLVVHGIFHTCVGGLFSVRDLFTTRRLIAPSRFGYLGSSMPQTATPALQADAFAALLETLGIRRIDVVALSAGATSALQLALRHPDKVTHLAVLNAAVNDYDLEAIHVPTLIVHTKDDRLASHEASKRAAERIPGARFVSLASGGHLMLGQTEIVRDVLADFFADSGSPLVDRVAS